MTVSKVSEAQSAATMVTRLSNSALSVPSPLAALAVACQMPPESPLMREKVLADAPLGSGALVLYPMVGAMAALGLAVFAFVLTRLVIWVEERTLTEDHPTPTPLMRPDQPARAI